ncbi:hypothetical protein CC79DRAFT_1336273 [Sarocladium strictum]
MLLLKSIVATAALGFLAIPVAATTACEKAVRAMYGAKDVCKSQLVQTVTVTPTSTVTVSRTVIPGKVTSDVTHTNTKLSTSRKTSTSLVTSILTNTVTAVQTITLTATVSSTVTATADAVTITVLPRKLAGPPRIKVPPSVAGVCDLNSYIKACDCLGIKPTTTTRTARAVTATSTKTVHKAPSVQTNTRFVTRTSVTTVYTTVTSTNIRTESATITNTISTIGNTLTSLQTVTVIPTATATAIVPPKCTGAGFHLSFTPAVSGGRTGVGFINSVGQGIFLQVFSSGSQFALDPNGDLTSFYTNDLKPTALVWPSDSNYLQLAYSSQDSRVSYTGQTTMTVHCGLGAGPEYEFQCVVPGLNQDQPLTVAVCMDRTFSPYLYVHVPGAAPPADLTCTDIAAKAVC